VNWCPRDQTVLANEQVVDGLCERCKSPVELRQLPQWFLRITDYAQALLDDMDLLDDWPERVLTMQRNWIGRSVGARVEFRVDGDDTVIPVFTTRPDTLHGATFFLLAPEHPLVPRLVDGAAEQDAVMQYVGTAARTAVADRSSADRPKTGVFTGRHVINPATGDRIPVWVADYVLMDYGTGAVMAVPGHDERDFAFARAFDLPIVRVVAETEADAGAPLDEAMAAHGVAVNSGAFSGMTTAACKAAITAKLAEVGRGEAKINYKLRDWVFSRQRYWGEPIPIVFPVSPGPGAPTDGTFDPREHDHVIDYDTSVPVPEAELPIALPETDDFTPTGDAQPPLARATAWRFIQRDYGDPDGQGGGLRWYARETNTMPQWAGSCWYYLRYIDPKNADALADHDKLRRWLPVDLYVGGAEHAVLHLLYARFWHKVLFDVGVVPGDEPFARLVNQGMILGEDSEKMSKSRGNVINPDDMLECFGADAFRLYEMFMGPLEATKPWQTAGLQGTRRFLDRTWRALTGHEVLPAVDARARDADGYDALDRDRHKLIEKVTADTDGLSFNTAIAAMMEMTNALTKYAAEQGFVPADVADDLVVLLAPYAPHIAEELWARLGHPPSVSAVAWPTFDPAKTVDDTVEMPVMVNGKVRAKLQVAADASKDALQAAALADERVQKWTDGKTIRKVIVVPGRMVSVVAK
jgi:leucyl-tRNA synthetase